MVAAGAAGSPEIPPEWERQDWGRLSGVVLVVGAPDTGKTTLARFLFDRLAAAGKRVAFLDGDPGQSRLGPPTTLTLSLDAENVPPIPEADRAWRFFVGSTQPHGHMLPMLAGAARLVQAAAAETVIYDTCGLVDPAAGGLALKLALVDLFFPVTVVALQREAELEPLLVPLRRSARAHTIVFHPVSAAVRRGPDKRQAYRREQYARHFHQARDLEVPWTRLAVFPLPRFRLGRLVALEDARGFTRALGVVTNIDRAARRITLHTPLPGLAGIDALRLGDVGLDLTTFRDEKLA